MTRSIDFSASLRYEHPGIDPQENRRLFGASASQHGHNYRLEVSVRGEVDPVSGRLVSVEQLDRVVRKRVLDRLDHRWLDREVPEFKGTVPTAENIARYVWDALKGEIAPGGLHRIRLEETAKNSVEYAGEREDV